MNVFDGLIVILSIVELVLIGNGDPNKNSAFSAFRSIRLFRTFRVLRVTRLIRLIHNNINLYISLNFFIIIIIR